MDAKKLSVQPVFITKFQKNRIDNRLIFRKFFGGDERDRTAYLLHAMQDYTRLYPL
jgi:hypothetical protein